MWQQVLGALFSGTFNKVLDVLLLVVPLVKEWIQKKRSEDESAAAYVRKEQAKKLEVAQAILAGDGKNLSRIAQTRLAVISALFSRVREIPESPGGK